MKVTFVCPVCEHPARLILDQVQGRRVGGTPTDGGPTAHPTPRDWQCAHCDQRLSIPAPTPDLPVCLLCGNHELYKKKAFPHWLGMTILITACVASSFTYRWYEKWLTWAILLGSAAFDGLLYLLVGDAIVCYRCQAHYNGIEPSAHHRPHELIIGERYRQERIRKEQIEGKITNRG